MELLLYHWENGPGEIRTRICDCDRVPCSPYTTGPTGSVWGVGGYGKSGSDKFFGTVFQIGMRLIAGCN